MHIHVDVSHSAVSPFRKLACNLKAIRTLFWRLLNISSFYRDSLWGQQAEKQNPLRLGLYFQLTDRTCQGLLIPPRKGRGNVSRPVGKRDTRSS